GLVHLGQVLRLDLLHGDEEIGFLAGHVLAVIVGRELQREGLRFTGLHAAHGLVEGLEHLAFADHELEALGLAALEGHAVDLAFEVDRDAVTFLRAFGGRTLREGAALLAQDVERLVDRGFAHFGRDLLHFGGGQVADLHFGLDGARQPLQARLHLVADGVGSQRQRNAAFELLEGFNVNGHDQRTFNFVAGARRGTRTPTPSLASGPKPGASTNFATRADPG